MKGHCDICGTEIEIHMCCSGYECSCMGQPIDPPICSEHCYNLYMIRRKKPYRKQKLERILNPIKK